MYIRIEFIDSENKINFQNKYPSIKINEIIFYPINYTSITNNVMMYASNYLEADGNNFINTLNYMLDNKNYHIIRRHHNLYKFIQSN